MDITRKVFLRRMSAVLATGVAAIGLQACASGQADAPSGFPSLKTGSVGPGYGEAPAGARKDSAYGPPAQRKVALLLPLSGPQQALGRALKQAGELAIFERDGSRIELMIRDDRGTADGARLAAEDVIRGGAELILGPVFSPSVAAVAPVAERSAVPVIAFSNDARVAGRGVHLLSYLPSQDIARTVEAATRQGWRRFALATPDDAFGRMIEPMIQSAVLKAGGVIAARSSHSGTGAGATACATTLRGQIAEAERTSGPIDAIFVPGGPAALNRMAQALAKAGVDIRRVKLIGTGGWEGIPPSLHVSANGAWLAAPEMSGWREFVTRYTKVYGSAPPRIATLAYDAVGVASILAATGEPRRLASDDLLRATGFPGAEGQFRFSASGITDRALGIYAVTREGPQLVEPVALPGLKAVPGPTASIYATKPSR
jgi:ABC-type branched-subunit amino acid transport system substrate-binding protein